MMDDKNSSFGLVDQNQDNSALAESLGMKILSFIPQNLLPKELYQKIPYVFAKRHRLLPIEEDQGVLIVAIADPLNLDALDELRLMLDREVKAVFCKDHVLMEAINQCYHFNEGLPSQLIANLAENGTGKERNEEDEVYDLFDNKDQAPVIRLINLVLSEAIQQGASDIHFEPFENDLKVRYRIDGVLQNRHTPAQEYQAQLLTRIKVMAKLDIAEHRLPQDGRIKLSMGGREIDFRVSTVPVVHGERIVLRILDKDNILLGLDKIGMLPTMLDEFRRLIALSEGIVLVTGPTGSGKTTTLYSAICEIFNQETNIMTIEDPVEYKLQGIAQIGVHHKIKLDFSTGLRHILRQDPDVIMIGEIRDRETAEIAIQAALTGHLVLSTLHTNDAPSAITRLVDMGIEPFLLSSSIVGVLAQRLVRTICPFCRETYEPIERELAELDLNCSDLMGSVLYRGKGCSQCFGSGYKGRHGIYELMTVDSHIETQIAKHAEAAVLRKLARKQGLISLREHGAHLVRAGMTTVSEILRATRKN